MPFTFKADGSSLITVYQGEHVPITPRERDVFEVFSSVVRFQRNRRGTVTGFTLAAPRAVGIVFEKR